MESNPEQTCLISLAEFSSSLGLLRWQSWQSSDIRSTAEATNDWTMCQVGAQLNDVFFHLLKRLSAIDQQKNHTKQTADQILHVNIEKIWINKMVGMTGGVLLVLAFL